MELIVVVVFGLFLGLLAFVSRRTMETIWVCTIIAMVFLALIAFLYRVLR